MRAPFVYAVLLLAFSQVAWAQEANPLARTASKAAKGDRNYLVSLVQVRFAAEGTQDLSPKDLPTQWMDWKQAGKVYQLESVVMSTIEGHESFVQFGNRTSIVVSTSTAFAPRNAGPAEPRVQKHTQDYESGTILRTTIYPSENDALPVKHVVELQFESSRVLDTPSDQDIRPITTTSKSKSQVIVELGKPLLVGGSDAKTATYLILTIDAL